MAWRPITDQHAIERVRIVVTFEQNTPPKVVSRLGSIVDDRREYLGFEPMIRQEGFAIQIGPDPSVAVQQPQGVQGWQFQRVSEGNSIEVLSLLGNALSLETADYDRWSKLLDRFTDLSSKLVETLLDLSDIASLSLEYFDRFYFTGEPEAAKPQDFLQEVSSAIPPAALDKGQLWHLHRGWFELEQHGRLLVNQNFDAQDGIVEDRPARSVQILTKADARKGAWDIAEPDLRPHLDVMHKRVNQAFASVLSPEMRQAIRLEVDDLGAS